uniref:Uncharacterized protein n=1 Tax=Alexandrium catenella TaxID=2925 RepID=A0A7S1QJ94_ALECA|mmetsp:Transcript_33312/g.90207  ORF Transcript_33312/g.90207 Transcript_33312/m.90207 type:complete len:264 (+) Transcript_33312:105-896(+)
MAGISTEKSPGGVAVITLAKEPVNSMNLDFWQGLLQAFEACENDPSVRAVIFRSGLKRSVFTAGLDVKELHAPSTGRERLLNFWRTLSRTLTRVYRSPMVTVAAIGGACPAAGCCLALCCDYRVITANGSMGLNEVQLGIPVPVYWVKLLVATIGSGRASRLLQTGVMPASSELLQLGMVDAMVERPDELLPHATAEAQRWLANPDAGRAATKAFLRGPLAETWEADIEADSAGLWETMNTAAYLKAIESVIARLSGGKAAKL